MTATDNRTALTFYENLAKELRTDRLSPAEVVARVRQRVAEAPPPPATIEALRVAAEARMVHSPREGWALASVAHAAAGDLADELLEAACGLTLAAALNALGRFAEAAGRLSSASEHFLAQNWRDLASRSYSEAALADTYLGQFDAAQQALTRAREALAGLDDPLAQAHCDRAEGLFHLEQNRYPEAADLLRRAGEVFAVAGRQDEAALAWCHLAETLRYIDPQAALIWLDKARRVPALRSSSVHAARCDFILAVIYEEMNRYTKSLILCRQARTVLAEEGLDFLTVLCDLYQGIAHYRLNRYDEALEAYSRARAGFSAQALGTHVARCDLNCAVVYYALNRYSEALALYQRVAEEAMAEGRALRAARCYTNMGLCYDQLGRYDLALILHDRARQAFLEAGDPVYAALCQENLAGTHRRLGRHEEALEHYRAARGVFAEHGMRVYVAYCDTYMADLYLALERHREALVQLEEARATWRREGMAVYAAICERETARVRARVGREDEALNLLAQAKAVLAEEELLVDTVLCDLAAGEMYLGQSEIGEAERCFAEALATLEPGFPDEAWRAQYGLGHCALIQEDRPRALAHWLSAVELINRIRTALPTERLSGGFFASHRQLYEEALELALEVGTKEQALKVAEAGKTQIFPALRPFDGAQGRLRSESAWTGHSGWRNGIQAVRRALRQADVVSLSNHQDGTCPDEDPYLAKLLNQEEALREEMASLRRELRLLVADETGPILRSEGELRSDQPRALARLAELARVYEEVVERLRLVAPGWLEPRSPPLFSVPALRQAAAVQTSTPLSRGLPVRWACLSYYLLDDRLITFFLDPQRLNVHRRSLDVYDRLVLRQCTDPARDFRELIYWGTIRGHRAPGTPGKTHLYHLYDLLIPPEVEELTDESLLIIAPHGPLHGLPFQALLNADGQPLVIKVPLTYVPSLSVLQSLLRESAGTAALERVLACGLSDFDARATPLPHAADEIAALGEVLGNRLHVLWGEEATRDTLLRLDEKGGLADYDVIHFATHAVLDHLAPSQSQVLLDDGGLTVMDILNLRLGAWMVVLSACEGAMGQQHPGDEIMGLARAFFLTGVRTVVASLWPVEDASAGEFMGRFYRRLGMGEGVAQALRAVQVEMADEGYVPYQWAPFIAIGLP